MTTPTVHIVGAGLAGLAAGLTAAEAGLKVRLHEAAPRAGGRCRTYWDAQLDARIDNGNHLMMSGNTAVLDLVKRTGAQDQLVGPEIAVYPFIDLETGRRWTVKPGLDRLPLWVLDPARSMPGAVPADFLEGLRLPLAGPDATVADVIRRRGALWRGFWEPLTVAALNTPPERGQARLLWRVLAETFLKGGAYCRPLMARDGLADALVDPTVAKIEALGGIVETGARVRALEISGNRVAALDRADGGIVLGPRDPVIVALPPTRARDLVPGLTTPDDGEAIVNAHFRLSAPPPPFPAGAVALGVLGGAAQWIFVRDRIASITISAPGPLAQADDAALLPRLWGETRQALALPDDAHYLAGRIIKERRAVFDQSPAGVSRRPEARTPIANLLLAGDWIDTGLPATIESALRAGNRAGALARMLSA